MKKRFVAVVATMIAAVMFALELDCEVLVSHDHRQHLIIHTARPGSESHDRLALLRVLGLQDMSPEGSTSPRSGEGRGRPGSTSECG